MPVIKIKELPQKQYPEIKSTDIMVIEDSDDTYQITVEALMLFFSNDEKLQSIIKYFPEVIKRQYQDLTHLIEKQSHTSSWWKDERNVEIHLDSEELYKSRQKEIVESKVMMDSLKLYNTLMAVSNFLGNAHACLFNFLVEKYHKGELSE